MWLRFGENSFSTWQIAESRASVSIAPPGWVKALRKTQKLWGSLRIMNIQFPVASLKAENVGFHSYK